MDATDRRDALRSLSAVGMALLAALGFHGASAKKNNGGGKNGGKGRHHRKQRRNRTQERGNQEQTDPAPAASDPPPSASAMSQADKEDKKQGPTGPAGSPSESRIKIGPQASGVGNITSLASCDPGWHAVGGGFVMLSPFSNMAAIQSNPDPLVDNGVATGWFVRAVNAFVFTQVQAYAICVPD